MNSSLDERRIVAYWWDRAISVEDYLNQSKKFIASILHLLPNGSAVKIVQGSGRSETAIAADLSNFEDGVFASLFIEEPLRSPGSLGKGLSRSSPASAATTVFNIQSGDGDESLLVKVMIGMPRDGRVRNEIGIRVTASADPSSRSMQLFDLCRECWKPENAVADFFVIPAGNPFE